MKTLNLPQAFQKFSEKELLHFLKRGKYDVEYRRARNFRLKGEREEYQRWKDSQGS